MAGAELERWMAAHVPGFEGPLALERLSGGQSNPTWRVRAASGDYVLRQKPVGKVLPSAHAVDREYRVMRALAATDVPVPRVHALCEDPSVMGSMFFAMDYLEGRVLFDPRLPDHAPEDRAAIFDAMNGAIAAISLVDPVAVGLGDYGRHGGYVERQVSRWTRQYRASETRPIPAMDALIGWLPGNLPQGAEEVRLVHGDYRLDNLILAPDRPEVAAVIDWELSTLGDPVADFSYHLMKWHMPPGLPASGTASLAGHDLAALGIPSLENYVASYEARTGLAVRPHLDIYLAYNFFRLAAILAGVAARGRAGNAPSELAARMGEAVKPLAGTAWRFARRAAG
jgi:aminoglycoside phosphotransferase (APT) family kinase protein